MKSICTAVLSSAVLASLLLCTPGFAQIANMGAPINTAQGDGSPALTADGLTMILSSSRTGGLGNGDLYVTTRTAVGAAWTTPTMIAELSTTYSEAECSISSDGLELAFSSSRLPNKGGNDLWLATRASTTAPWNAPVPLDAINNASNQNGAFLGPDGLTIYWHQWQNATSGDPDDIWMATRPDRSSPFANPVAVTAVNSANGDDCPFVTADNLTMYFASNRAGGSGDFDIWIAHRATPTSPWIMQGNAIEVNSTVRDFHCVLSANGNEFFVESQRDGFTGTTRNSDLWYLNHAPTQTAVDPALWGLFE